MCCKEDLFSITHNLMKIEELYNVNSRCYQTFFILLILLSFISSTMSYLTNSQFCIYIYTFFYDIDNSRGNIDLYPPSQPDQMIY